MSYATIIAAIDAAIEAWAGKPVTVTLDGHTNTYRTFDELRAARKYYAGLVAASAPSSALRMTRFNSGGTI